MQLFQSIIKIFKVWGNAETQTKDIISKLCHFNLHNGGDIPNRQKASTRNSLGLRKANFAQQGICQDKTTSPNIKIQKLGESCTEQKYLFFLFS